jgi:Flp pilus assembly protein TadD
MPPARPHAGAADSAASDPAARAAREWRVALVAILALGLFARLLYLSQVAALPFFGQPVGDSAVHLKRAAEIAAGQWLPTRPFYYCSIFYPYFLAAALALGHGSLWVVCAIQVFAGLALITLLALAARWVYGDRAGIAAALIAALYGPAAFFECDVLGVVWGQLSLAIALIATLRWAAPIERRTAPRAAWLGLAGLSLGLAVVERPNLLVVAPLLALWCVAQAGRVALRSLALLAGGVALPLAAVLALNVAGTGQWVPLTTSAGINLSLSYHDGATGTFDEPWERSSPEFAARHTEPEEAMVARASTETGRALTPQQASIYWRDRALEWIRAHPREAAAITVEKAALLLNGSEVPNHLDYDFIRRHARALWLMPIGFGGVLALGMLGLADALRDRRRRAAAWLLALVSGGAFAGILPFTVADRYRVTLVPALMVAAGGGVVAIARIARDRTARPDRATTLTLGAGLVAALVASVPLVHTLGARNQWMFAQAYEQRGDLRDAIAAYEAAVREDGSRGELLNNLAMAYRAAGDRPRAEATLRRAIAAEPRLAYPHKNLGMLLIVRGVRDSALAELREAQRLAPDDAETAGAIGALLAERGDRAAAREAFERARALAPADPRLSALIEHYAAELK